jgi:hypothetical protein
MDTDTASLSAEDELRVGLRGLVEDGEDLSEEEPGGGPGEWVSIREAAKRLGIDPKSVRNRIARDTLKWRHKGNQGREVWLEPADTLKEEPEDCPRVDPRDLSIARLEERVASQERLLATQEHHVQSLEEQIRWLRLPFWKRWAGL